MQIADGGGRIALSRRLDTGDAGLIQRDPDGARQTLNAKLGRVGRQGPPDQAHGTKRDGERKQQQAQQKAAP